MHFYTLLETPTKKFQSERLIVNCVGGYTLFKQWEENILKWDPKYLFYAGCFYPPTKGHLKVVQDNLDKFDRVHVFVWDNYGSFQRYGIDPN